MTTLIKTNPNSNVNLRTKPEILPATVLTMLKPGTVVTAEKRGDWYVLETYLHSSVVTELPPPPAIPVGSIPYRSQWAADANNRSADCGQTCAAMLAESRGIQVAVNDLRFQSASNGLSTGSDLVDNLKYVGLKAHWEYISNPSQVPFGAICLIKYSGLKRASVQDINYQGWHWVVFISIDGVGVTVHDPDFWGSRTQEGAFKRYALSEWQNAFIPNGAGRVIVVLED